MRALHILTVGLMPLCLFGQQSYLNHPADIQDYKVRLEVYEEHDTVVVSEAIALQLSKPCDSFFLDLASVDGGKGMEISAPILNNGQEILHVHREDRIWLYPDSNWMNATQHLEIEFKGIPQTGLIIGKNKFGTRTYFGDNWPNRAHHWFACIDHPSDKATVSFTAQVPPTFECISTGLPEKPITMPEHSIYKYSSSIPLPTKVMVVGIADFAVHFYESPFDFEVSAWTYPEDSSNGTRDMEVSLEVLEYFMDIIGEYPFEKLANVQSTTQFGGMENAGNIFYDENAITGAGSMEALIAHEIAHQWFGNSASERDWPHLWLSEGFATYLTDLYWEHKYGREAMNKRLIGERNRVIKFAETYQHPVVDTEYAELMHLLNPNSYQKGAWVLHMLREKIGDEAFFNGLRAYYTKFQLSNATTDDFMSIMESASSQSLSNFFEQWLHRPLHPILKIDSRFEEQQKTINVVQLQDGDPFVFELEVELLLTDGTSEMVTLHVEDKSNSFPIHFDGQVKGLRYDPEVKLLFELREH
jgi:aminopeptidase N